MPPYGYRAETYRHPNPAKAEEGKTKIKLVPDEVRGPVVTQIFVWRVTECLSYAAIRDRLNADLDRYPVPTSPDPAKQRTTWNRSAVASIPAIRSTPAIRSGTGARVALLVGAAGFPQCEQ